MNALRLSRASARTSGLLLLGALLATPALGVATAVSPGAVERAVPVATPCPTFDWAAVPGAAGYELIVLDLARVAATADATEPAVVLRHRIVAAALGWTPGREQCLAAGSYAWTVRALTATGEPLEGERVWATPLRFTIPAAPSAAEVAEAIEILRRWQANGSASSAGASRSDRSARELGGKAVEVSGTSAIRGENPAATGAQFGVTGQSASTAGAGLVGINLSGGADLILDGASQGRPDAYFYENGIDLPGGAPTTFNVRNSGAGVAKLQVDGVDVLTTAGAGAHDHFGQFWVGTATDGLRLSNADPNGQGIFILTSSPTGGATAVRGEAHGSNGWGVVGMAATTTGGGVGVSGQAVSTQGTGVYGWATATSGIITGTWGKVTSPNGRGVYGQNEATYGQALGVFGNSSSTEGRGVLGQATATSGNSVGVYGLTFSPTGTAIYGLANAGAGDANGIFGRTQSVNGIGAGVYGATSSTQGRGVQGVAEATTGNNWGVWGTSNSTNGFAHGVYGDSVSTQGVGVGGEAKSTQGRSYGVTGASASTEGIGVYGIGVATSGVNYGVMAVTNSASGYGLYAQAPVVVGGPSGMAGHFYGNVNVTGMLTKGGGAFRIDHPLAPERAILQHSFVESPDMKNVYDGVALLDARGEAWVELPAWFEALNRDFRYQLTPLGSWSACWIGEKIRGNRFLIRGGPGAEVSWQVTGIRHDRWAEQNRIEVEVEKPEAERGTYLHPEAWGLGPERGVEATRRALPDPD